MKRLKKFASLILLAGAIVLTSTIAFAEPFLVFKPTNGVVVTEYELDLDGTVITVVPTNGFLVYDLQDVSAGPHEAKARGRKGWWWGPWTAPLSFNADRPILDAGEIVASPPEATP